LYNFSNQLQNNPSANYAVIRLTMNIKYQNQKLSEAFRHTICNEALASADMVIYTQKNFALLDEINEKIELLKSAGLMEFWYHKYIDRSSTKVELTQPIPLALRHVESCFIVLVLGILLSMILLLTEILSMKTRNN
jgi:hypothetical protein